MPKTHRRLRSEDRGVIYRMNQAGKSQMEIAEAIGFSQGTVSKELSRNRGMRGYRPAQAHAAFAFNDFTGLGRVNMDA